MSLAEAAAVLGARVTGGDHVFHSVSTDTRTLEPGALFVALRGERFDGHDYIEAAMSAGAAGVLGERAPEAVPAILVDDSLDALQRLAADWRGRFSPGLVAVTGSNGKTTVKEMIAAILSPLAPTLASRGNLNNHIGVPLSLLRLRREHRFAVIEMGMNHAGELTLLSRLAAPNVALVTNAAPAHLEGLGTVEKVAAAKGEVFSGLGAGGIAVINADDAFADYWRGLNRGRRIVTFGLDAAADVTATVEPGADASRLRIRAGGKAVNLRLAAAGMHNAMNALAAAAAATALGVELDAVGAGLEAFTPVAGRSQMVELGAGGCLINDCYNANPASMAAAIDLLARQQGTRILVMGDMGELGERSEDFHREAGERARQAGIDRLFCFGPLSALACRAFGPGAAAFDDVDALSTAVAGCLGSDVTVLVKGSRAMRMERVADALAARAGGARRC